MSDHRWQGHSHQELFGQIHEGPGAEGSTESIRRWQELTRVLGEIDDGLASALTSAMSGWKGAAAESVHSGLRPLGDWAQEARNAADMMRERAEEQANFISKARNDMPPPVNVRAEDPGLAESFLTHLIGGQTDFEVQEARQNAAEQHAFEVMRTYESATTANTTSLASFAPPPQVVVDSPALQGAPPSPRGNQGITISWGATPVSGLPSPRSAGRSAGAGASTSRRSASGQNRASRENGATRGQGSGRGVPSSGGSRAGGAGSSTVGRGHQSRDDDDSEPVDRGVTEEFGNPGGLFDEPQTLSKPVIGGEPN